MTQSGFFIDQDRVIDFHIPWLNNQNKEGYTEGRHFSALIKGGGLWLYSTRHVLTFYNGLRR
jgi:hypothetical protein